jgi:tetratricopeptide (TPR) repeat protein
MMIQAQEHLDSGQFAEAEAIYRSLIKEDAAHTQAIFMLALARKAQGDLEEAISLMERAASQDPDNANIHYTLGTFQMSAKSVDEARKSYLSALQADPEHLESHNGLAYVELLAGNFQAAENAANLALNEDRKNVQALVYMGTAKLEQGDSTKAISYLQEALKESPTHQSARLHLGRAFLAAGNYAFASQCFSNIVDGDENAAVGWEYLGKSQLANGEQAAAAQSFQKAFSLGRKSPDVLAAMEAIRKADPAGAAPVQGKADPEFLVTGAEFEIARGNPAAALQILSAEPTQGDDRVSVLRARAYEQLRDHDAALAIIEPLANRADSDEEAGLAYVRLLSKAGRETEADQWIDQLLSKDEPPLFARVYRGFQLCRRGESAGILALQEIENEAELSNVDKRRVSKTLAESLDRAGRFDEATDYYAKLSGRLAQVLPVADGSARANREFLESKSGPLPAVARVDISSLPADPVFTFAWPGSGWEWMAVGLGAHPGLMLVADRPETQTRRRAIVSEPEGREALKNLGSDEAGQRASQYWADLKSGQLDPGSKITLDTMWLSADMLPTLARIFPAMKVVVVVRDPREMVLDWFRSGYSDLQDMAAIYREQLEALSGYRELLEIDFVDVDGAALQADAVPELKKLHAAIDLEWNEAVGDHLKAVAPKIDAGRGGWEDYSKVLAGPLNLIMNGDQS